MNIVFMGTPDFALPALQSLAKRHNIVCIYSQPARPKGRGYELIPSPVAALGRSLDIPVRTPVSLKSPEEQASFKALPADVAIVAAYGLILPGAMLDAFPMGCINIHGSLLPKWRGAAPIQRAVMAGDKETGITIMKMAAGMDTGDILLQQSVRAEGKTSAELFDELAASGAEAIIKYLDNPARYPAVPQDEAAATYALKIGKEETELDFRKSATQLERQIRAIPSWFIYKGERIKVHKATVLDMPSDSSGTTFGADSASVGHFIQGTDIICGQDSVLRLDCLQRAGKSALPAAEFLRGFTFD